MPGSPNSFVLKTIKSKDSSLKTVTHLKFINWRRYPITSPRNLPWKSIKNPSRKYVNVAHKITGKQNTVKAKLGQRKKTRTPFSLLGAYDRGTDFKNPAT